MDPNIIAALTAVGGVAVGAITAYIAIRKMPSEIGSTESITLKNLLDSNLLLSNQLKSAESERAQQKKDIAELRSWFTGSLEIITKLELSDPPRVLAATVKRIPHATDSA